jgi:hypothetical protein
MIRVSPFDVHDAWAADVPWPEDDDLAGLSETVVEPGDGRLRHGRPRRRTRWQEGIHASRKESPMKGFRLRFPFDPEGEPEGGPPAFDDLVEALIEHGNDGHGIDYDLRDDARRQIRRLLRAFDDVTDTAPPGLSAAELTARVRARCPDVSYPFAVVEEVDCDGEPVMHRLSIHLPHRLRETDGG